LLQRSALLPIQLNALDSSHGIQSKLILSDYLLARPSTAPTVEFYPLATAQKLSSEAQLDHGVALQLVDGEVRRSALDL